MCTSGVVNRSFYEHWDGLVDLLANDLRWTSICTNGTLIEKRLESLVRISSHLEVSISIHGFEREHDSLRGRGTFRRTMNGLLLLVEQKKQGAFLGRITVNCVITDAMVSRMFEFVQFLEEKGVETVYVSFPWYISAEHPPKWTDIMPTIFVEPWRSQAELAFIQLQT